MIEVHELAKAYGRKTLWAGLSFKVAAGEMLALVGPSGSGKSTLLNCIGLLDTPDAGRIVVDGEEITRFGPAARRRFRRDKLGYLFQSYALIENVTINENLDVAVGAGNVLGRSRRKAYEEALDRVGLAGRGRHLVYQLSGGEQQRVAVARLLLRQPRIVLADEPTGALDQGNGAMVIELLRDLSTRGCAVVIATHNPMVEAGCSTTLDLGSAEPATERRAAGTRPAATDPAGSNRACGMSR